MSNRSRALERLRADRDHAEREIARWPDNLVKHAYWLAKLNVLDREIADTEFRP